MSDASTSAPTAGVGVRRKGLQLPKLPSSAFSPPNSAQGETFPGSEPEATTTHSTDGVIDAHVVASEAGDLSAWTQGANINLAKRISGVVVFLKDIPSEEIERATKNVKTSPAPVVSVAVPFELKDGPSATPLAPGTSLFTVFDSSSDPNIAGIKCALESGVSVDIEIKSEMSEDLEDFLTKAFADLKDAPPVVLSNILPPPHDFSLPIVKLMNHPSYRAFQSHTAALSLMSPNLFVKFLPPSWDAPTPSASSAEGKEWKRRIKMYLGPMLEAFGERRLIFGSSGSSSTANASDWYEIARECLAELGVEQEAVDAVFHGNAKKVYGSSA